MVQTVFKSLCFIILFVFMAKNKSIRFRKSSLLGSPKLPFEGFHRQPLVKSCICLLLYVNSVCTSHAGLSHFIVGTKKRLKNMQLPLELTIQKKSIPPFFFL